MNIEPTINVPVYHESLAYARAHDEIELFRDSHIANIFCQTDIEEAIKRNFDGMHLNKSAVTEILDRFGEERVSVVLAATVQLKDWDGRFSGSNKAWASSVVIPDMTTATGFDRRCEFAVTSHPAIVDGFINLTRQEIKERSQPQAKIEPAQPAAPAAKRSRPKFHNMER